MDDFRKADIETPCIKVCVVDPETQICIGCGRSRDEIANWLILSPKARHEVVETLPERLATLTLRKRRKGGRQGRLSTLS